MSDSLVTKLLGGIVSSAAGYIGDQGAQWILSAEFGVTSSSQQILNDLSKLQSSLDTIEGKIEDLQNDFSDFYTAWKANNDYVDATSYIASNVKEIDTAYDKLTGGTLDTDKDDLISSAYDFSGDLDAIHEAMTGAMDLYPGVELLKSVASVNVASTDPPPPISQSYAALQSYFETMVKVQTRGLILQLNRDLAKSDAATTDSTAHLAKFRANLAAQYEHFLAAAELLTVLYYKNDALLDTILGPQADASGTVIDPMRAAFDYINDNRLAGDGPFWRVYYWEGSGPGWTTGDSKVPTAITLSGAPNPDVSASATPVTFQAGGNVWTMSRFDFVSPRDGIYNVLSPEDQGNVRLDGTGTNVGYGPAQVTVYNDVRGGIQPQTCAFSSITVLSIDAPPGTYIATGYQPAGAFTAEVQFAFNVLGGAVLANGNAITTSSSRSGHNTSQDSGWWEFGVDSGGNVYVQGETAAGETYGPSTGGLTAAVGDWHYYVVTWDGANLVFGFDGNVLAQIPTGAITGSGITVGARVDVTTAANQGNSGVTSRSYSPSIGQASELRLWNIGTSYGDFTWYSEERFGAGNDDLFAVYGFDRGNASPRCGSSSGFAISGSNVSYIAVANPPAMEDDDPTGPTVSYSSDAVQSERAGTRLLIKARPAPSAPATPPTPRAQITLTPRAPQP
ncbi:MAG: hypothetical protein QOE68_2104 [Thermoanaerobaculia bacterium]|nr:hypothetical protein [Thermoanaerobaculia bacterium]